MKGQRQGRVQYRSASSRSRSGIARRSAGFTLAEQVCVMALISILTAIAAPSWVTFFRHRQLVAAQERTASVIRSVQHQANLSRTQQAIAFRQTAAGIEWSLYATSDRPTDWQSLSNGVAIDSDTTLEDEGEFYRLRFNEDGHVVGLLGRLTLTIDGTRMRRCVLASTLLGELRRAAGDRCTR